MTSSRSNVKYHIVPGEWRDQNQKNKTSCPKLTRYKFVAIVTIFIVVVFFTVLYGNYFHHSSICLNRVNSSIDIPEQIMQHLPHTKRRLPQCLIIGSRKSGTRALLSFLNIHPDIQTVGQELHFFDDDDNYRLGYDWYRKKMPYSYKDQITIEKTPSYIVDSDSPERVYSMNNTIKLIVIVKEPVERTISDYAQFRENKILRNKPVISFESLVIDPDTGEINRSNNAIRRSIYCRHLQKWLRYFSLDQIKIVDGDKLKRAPWKELHKVETFLGLKHVITKDNFIFNETRGFYCKLNRNGSEKCLSLKKGRKHPQIKPWIINKLKQFYFSFNEKFFKMTGRNFDWNDGLLEEEEEEEKDILI